MELTSGYFDISREPITCQPVQNCASESQKEFYVFDCVILLYKILCGQISGILSMVKVVFALGVIILTRLFSDTDPDPIHNDLKSQRSDSKISKKECQK